MKKYPSVIHLKHTTIILPVSTLSGDKQVGFIAGSVTIATILIPPLALVLKVAFICKKNNNQTLYYMQT